MNKIWNELDHRLSVVVRWGTAETIHKQSVAEHIFNVERLAVRIAREWFGVVDDVQLYAIMRFAHHHEDSEALSGDLPTMIKPYFDTAAFEAEHEDLVRPVAAGGDWVRNIVKLADMLDSWWFLCVEKSLGSFYLDNHINHEPRRIIKFVETMWPADPDLKGKVWQLIGAMWRLRSTRHSMRGR